MAVHAKTHEAVRVLLTQVSAMKSSFNETWPDQSRPEAMKAAQFSTKLADFLLSQGEEDTSILTTGMVSVAMALLASTISRGDDGEALEEVVRVSRLAAAGQELVNTLFKLSASNVAPFETIKEAPNLLEIELASLLEEMAGRK